MRFIIIIIMMMTMVVMMITIIHSSINGHIIASVIFLIFLFFQEWIPDPKDLNILLQRVGINLEEREMNDLLQSLPVGGKHLK